MQTDVNDLKFTSRIIEIRLIKHEFTLPATRTRIRQWILRPEQSYTLEPLIYRSMTLKPPLNKEQIQNGKMIGALLQYPTNSKELKNDIKKWHISQHKDVRKLL